MRVLILCTGNSCRSQMAEGFVRALDPSVEVYSAGTHPAEKVHPIAVQVMREIGIDLSGAYPKQVERFLSQDFDYIITVCDQAREACPVFPGRATRRLHYSFPDPAAVTGSPEDIVTEFRAVRDQIGGVFTTLVKEMARAE